MKSRIFWSKVTHGRKTPVAHSFQYNVYTFAIDLDELDQLSQRVKFFGYNKFALSSIYDADYLLEGSESIKQKLISFLQNSGCEKPIDRIVLITSARYFGYVFNPVSFYYCYNSDGNLEYAVAEVNNTFKERHLYILNQSLQAGGKFVAHYTVPKSFHVSPFYDMNFEYDFHFGDLSQELDIRINLLKEGKVDFVSRIYGSAIPLTTANLLKTIMRFPLSAALTYPRILWQAAKLYYLKKLQVYKKPAPSSPMTIRTRMPNLFERFSMRLILNLFKKIKYGRVVLALPDGRVENYGNESDALRIELKITDYRFFSLVFRLGAVGFGDAYMQGYWQASEVSDVVRLLIENREITRNSQIGFSRLFSLIGRLRHAFRANTIWKAKKNIEAHYDLSNDFFRLFLDDSLTYSCALFKSPDDSLAVAQINKINSMIQKARIADGNSVLEIGSGWGAFSLEAAKKTGCKITTLTLSDEQKALTEQRIKDAGLEQQVEVRLCDYRHAEGQYDRIVSIEMLEAVGQEYLEAYFAACERLLKPNGLVVLQVITLPEHRYEQYTKSCDWIQKHIFPGCHIPSLTALSHAITKSSDLVIEDIENLAPHYARTLREWRIKLIENSDKVKALGFDDTFRRMWEYYLAYCEAGFATRTLGVHQVVLTRPNNKMLRREDAKVVGPRYLERVA